MLSFVHPKWNVRSIFLKFLSLQGDILFPCPTLLPPYRLLKSVVTCSCAGDLSVTTKGEKNNLRGKHHMENKQFTPGVIEHGSWAMWDSFLPVELHWCYRHNPPFHPFLAPLWDPIKWTRSTVRTWCSHAEWSCLECRFPYMSLFTKKEEKAILCVFNSSNLKPCKKRLIELWWSAYSWKTPACSTKSVAKLLAVRLYGSDHQYAPAMAIQMSYKPS